MDVKTVQLFVGTVLVAALFQFAFGADCGDYGFACTSCTTLQLCTNDVATGVNLTCPDDMYCSVTSSAFCTTDVCSDSDTTTTDATTTDATTTDATTTDATTTDATTTDATTTEATTTENFTCTAEGRFANTSDTTCQSYYFCFLNGTGYSVWELTCPTTTVFNPTTALCVASTDYNCTTSTTTTTTDATTTDDTTDDFNCTAEGRFANTSDTTCQSYYFCFLNGTGYSVWELTCPTTTVFNPTTALCVASTDYNCTTETTTTTTTEATTTTTEATTTTTAATTTTTFSCAAYGRFADTTDSTCQSYYFCYLDGSTYTLLSMTCPTTTVFNPTTAKCVASTAYTCTN